EEAHKALADKNLILAQAKYQQAGKLFATDAVLTGLQRVEAARAQTKAEAEASRKKAAEEQDRVARLKALLAEGTKAHAAQHYPAAVAALTQARKIAPDNVEVLAALTKASQARDKAQAESRRKAEETGRAQKQSELKQLE